MLASSDGSAISTGTDQAARDMVSRTAMSRRGDGYAPGISTMLLFLAATCLTDPATLLDANRGATAQGAAARSAIVSRYDASGQGLTGSATTNVDPATGRFVIAERLGPSSETNGYDGREAWMRDLSGFSSPQAGGDRAALARSEAYRLANLWWRPDRGGARIRATGCGALHVVPPAGTAFDAWFDPATHLLTRVREQRSFNTLVETRYADYRRRGGNLVATRITTIYDDDPGSAVTWRLSSRSAAPGAAFSRRVRQPEDWSIPAPGRVTLPFRLLNNHVIIDVKVDGQGPFPFLLDTGGHDIVTPATATRIGLNQVGAALSAGGGEATTTNGYAHVREIDVGGARLTDQNVVTLDFSPYAVEGIRLGGMIGVEFLERFVVTIDYGRRMLTIAEPARAHAARPPAGRAVPFLFYAHMPQVRGTFGGRPARFNIDTGSRADVTLTSPFVAQAGLRGAFPGAVLVTDGWGVGGPSRSYIARAPALTLGAVTVAGPIAGLSSARHGAFSDPGYEGNVGSGLLKRFTVTFDYGRRLMYLAPASRADADTGRFDRTGMWINLGEGGLEIVDVLAAGPADRAGLRAHDLVTAIDGAAFDTRSLSDWRSAFKTLPAGRAIDIAYRRGADAGHARLIPRELVP